jgi:glycosyltransferase involved in cell wall biosynthesis
MRIVAVPTTPDPADAAFLATLGAEPEVELDIRPLKPVSELRQELDAVAPDAVLVTGSSRRGVAIAGRAARGAGLPAFLRCDWNDLERLSLLERWQRRMAVRRFSGLLAVGRANRRFLEQASGRPERVLDSPNGVDVALFEQSTTSLRPHRKELREVFGVAPDLFCVLFAAPLEPWARPLDLVDALATMRRERSLIRVLILGEGPLEADIRARAAELRLPVTFASRRGRDDLLGAYATADSLACTSDASDRWSWPVQEAMASGLPAVVSNEVGNREDLIEEGTTGFSYPTGNPDALAACLTTLAADPIRAAGMGEAARACVSGRFSLSDTGATLVRGLALSSRPAGP